VNQLTWLGTAPALSKARQRREPGQADDQTKGENNHEQYLKMVATERRVSSRFHSKILDSKQETSMYNLLKISAFAVTALIAAAALGIHEAHAGYVDIFGIYHPTCWWTIYGTYVCG
jgi:hypothetical protein